MRVRERVAITLSRDERSALVDLARRRGEPSATTAARLVRVGLARGDEPLTQQPRPSSEDERTAPWLPPTARAAAIEALRDRYPHDLRTVSGDFLEDRLVAERLAALSVWRDELDAGMRPDPREELAFAAELSALAKWLDERGRKRAVGSGRG